MRLLNLYAVIDTRAGAIVGRVIHGTSPVPLVRELSEEVNNDKSLIGRNPEDFIVVRIARIDDETGTIYSIEEDIQIAPLPTELVTRAIALVSRTPSS